VVLGGRLSVREEEDPKLLLDTVEPLYTDAELSQMSDNGALSPARVALNTQEEFSESKQTLTAPSCKYLEKCFFKYPSKAIDLNLSKKFSMFF